MQAGNKHYSTAEDIPAVIPVFPLSGALLLPGVHMPLNIFEPRYVKMIDDAFSGSRLIGMIQPSFEPENEHRAVPHLCDYGCIGRLVTYQESGDGRYLITLAGVARFKIIEELGSTTPYRQCRVSVMPFIDDLKWDKTAPGVDREALLVAFRDFLKANDLEADWESINATPTASLVNSLCVMSPYGPAEKQALLEAPDFKTRADTLIAITEVTLARESGEDRPLQ